MLPVLPRCCGKSWPDSAIDACCRWRRTGLWGHGAGIPLTPQSVDPGLHAPPFLLGLIDALCFLIDGAHGGPTHEVRHIHAAPRRRQRALTVTVIVGGSAVGAFLRSGAVMMKRASNCQSAKVSEIDPDMSVPCADADTLG